MKKIVSLALAALMIVTVFAASFSAFAAEPDYMYEYLPEGTVDVLTGAKGTFYCDQNATGGTDDGQSNNGRDLGTLLTDGIIAANANAASTPNRIHLNYECAKTDYVASIAFAGLEDKFYYAVEFTGLNAVTAKSFTLYYSGQEDGTLIGRSIPEGHTDKDVTILYSTDGGVTYQIAFDSNVGDFGWNYDYTEPVEFDTTAEGGFFNYRISRITLNQAINGITNLVYAARTQRNNSASWPARISEVSAFEGEIPETTKAPETTKDPTATKAPVTTKAPATTKAPDTTAAPETAAAPETTAAAEEKGCGSVAAIGVAMVVALMGAAVIRKKN